MIWEPTHCFKAMRVSQTAIVWCTSEHVLGRSLCETNHYCVKLLTRIVKLKASALPHSFQLLWLALSNFQAFSLKKNLQKIHSSRYPSISPLKVSPRNLWHQKLFPDEVKYIRQHEYCLGNSAQKTQLHGLLFSRLAGKDFGSVEEVLSRGRFHQNTLHVQWFNPRDGEPEIWYRTGMSERTNDSIDVSDFPIPSKALRLREGESTDKTMTTFYDGSSCVYCRSSIRYTILNREINWNREPVL